MINNCCIVRFDEIGLKAAHTKNEFVKLLTTQMKKIFPADKVKSSPYRLIIFSKNVKKAAMLASKVFGVNSVSPALMIEPDIKLMKKAAYSLYRKGKSFRISCQRSDKDYYLNSEEICRQVGHYVYERGGKVDLKNFETNIQIDLFNKKAFIFREKIKGFGGLPAGCQGKIACLMNNDRDYLACLMMMNRGCLPIIIGKKKFYDKLAKNFGYLKIQHFKELKYSNYSAMVCGNDYKELLKGFSCPIFYPLAFIEKSYAKEKFKAIN